MKREQIDLLPNSLNLPNHHQLRGYQFLGAVRLDWRVFLTGGGLFGIFVVLLAVIQFSTPNLAGNDGYFHIRFAQVMREQGLRPPFPWLPLTILNPEDYYDHHFLYHVLMIPFTYGDLRTGAKWLSVIFTAAAFLTGWILLRGQRVLYPALWSFGFFGVSQAFLFRLAMPRVQSISLLMLFLILHATLTQRYRWLLPLTFIYVWLYDAFPFALLIVSLYVASHWLHDRSLNFTPLVYTLLGISLGLLINPYFPNNLHFIYHHILPKLTDTATIEVGSEWYPYSTSALLRNAGFAIFTFIAGTIALGLRQWRTNICTTALLLITIAFGLLLLKHRRFVEYFPAFALLFCAMAWKPIFKAWPKNRPEWDKALPVILVLFLVLTAWLNIQGVRKTLQDTQPYERLVNVSTWLRKNTPLGSRIFQTNWDDFPRIYFYNTHNTYTLGLDPTYMQSYDAEMYELWKDISQGRVEQPAQAVIETFGSSYILTDVYNKSFLKRAQADRQLIEVYRDKDGIIFRVLAQADNANKKKGG